METFFALIPSEPLMGFLLDCKRLAREACGDQQFLADPPHLTLSVGCYEDRPGLREAVAASMEGLLPGVGIAGWQVFRDDPVTGGHTLVLKPESADKEWLRAFQAALLQAASGFRTRPVPDRYRDRSRFTPAMLASLERHGYPFVGDGWEPHFTVASFAPAAFEAAQGRLSGLRPPPRAGFEALALFRAEAGGGFVAVRKWGMGQSRE